MDFGISEAALLLSCFLAGYLLRTVGDFSFGLFEHLFIAILADFFLVSILLLPAILISVFAECDNRGVIALIGFLGGALVDKGVTWYRKRRGNATGRW